MHRRLCFLMAALPLAAGPVEFGLAEFRRAIEDRRLNPERFRIRTEITREDPESWRIEATRISGGDLRGVMYGLLAAAEQIRLRGALSPARGQPATAMRGIRVFVHNQELEQSWYYSHDYWRDFFAMLARNRFNRFNLVFAHQTSYLAPPYPFWLEVNGFPEVRVAGLGQPQRTRNLDMLRFISQTASDHAIDFTLGIWEHNVQPGMRASVEGLTRANIGPYSYGALKKLLAACPAIRGVQMRTNAESGIPPDFQLEFYRDWVWRAMAETGRRVTLDLRGWAMRPGMLEAAAGSGVPLRLSAKYWAEDLGRPYQPAETWPGYSYLGFLRKPRPYEFYWELWGLGSHRLLLWGDPEYVRRAVGTFGLAGSIGFEIDPPLAQKGFGNRPGSWTVFSAAESRRVFWKHEFERYWLFYLLWGRLSYDPKTPVAVWLSQFERRFGLAGEPVLSALESASGVLHEIVNAHLADPNMYIWPEINPGGLIEAYREALPSDWRFVATIPEAVRNRVRGQASAKQTPLQTAERLHGLALATENALASALRKLPANHREWLSTEPDLRVLAALARYHGRKQMAADHLTYFYETTNSAGLHAAHRELTGARTVWRDLVRLTDGIYPEEMAFGPDDTGHWKHKLPYVEHDLNLVEQRLEIWNRFGAFDYGFDFGGPLPPGRGSAWRNDPYVLRHSVEPRFLHADAGTRFDEVRGYGWTGAGWREAVPLPATPYTEIRATARDPRGLPRNTLFGDSIRGRGRQVFRVRTGNGEFAVLVLYPDGTAREMKLTSTNGDLDIAFPDTDWSVSGLVIHSTAAKPSPLAQQWPVSTPRPAIEHTPPPAAVAGKPLKLHLKVGRAASYSVRLHYRPLDQAAKFKTVEAGTDGGVIIPGEDLTATWDLLYYFEILGPGGSGWFHPDPLVTTPYYVVGVVEY